MSQDRSQGTPFARSVFGIRRPRSPVAHRDASLSRCPHAQGQSPRPSPRGYDPLHAPAQRSVGSLRLRSPRSLLPPPHPVKGTVWEGPQLRARGRCSRHAAGLATRRLKQPDEFTITGWPCQAPSSLLRCPSARRCLGRAWRAHPIPSRFPQPRNFTITPRRRQGQMGGFSRVSPYSFAARHFAAPAAPRQRTRNRTRLSTCCPI
jgi:hypothetical protein